MPACVRLYLWSARVRCLAHCLHTRRAGATAPGIPCALLSQRGPRKMHHPDNFMPRECGLTFVVIARSESDDVFAVAQRAKAEAIQTVPAGAVWIASRSLSSGRAFARTRWLAMTGKLLFDIRRGTRQAAAPRRRRVMIKAARRCRKRQRPGSCVGRTG